MDSYSGFDASLDTKLIRRPHRARTFRTPFGRVMFTRDKGDAEIFSDEVFATNLTAFHRDGDGKMKHIHDLGSGLVTNVGVMALANDFAWASGNSTLRLANYHASGTGTTAAAATDIQLQTVSTNGGQTPVSGTQSLVSAANSQKYQSVATISYTGAEAVTEWGLFTAGTLSSTAGSPFTNTTATGASVTGTPYTASTSTVPGEQQHIAYVSASAVYGLITANTTSNIIIPAWYSSTTGAAGATPSTTAAFAILPVMWDHKVFTAINVVSGDSIQYTYSLVCNSGG